MKKLLILFILFTFFGIYLNAQDVYVNNFKYKYHTKDCKIVNSTYFAIDVKEANKKGFKPCKECNPNLNLTSSNENLSVNDNTPLEFSKIIYTDSVGKGVLFSTINDWFATNFKSANDVIQMVDKDAGIIIGKGTFEYSYGQKISYICYIGYINFTIKVYVKDNRYKVEFLNFNHESGGSQYSSPSCSLGLITSNSESSFNGLGKSFHNNVWSDVKEKINIKSEMIFNSLELKTKNIKILNDKDGW